MRQPSEYILQGTAKMLTLFHPAGGQVRVRGVLRCPNAVLHPWLKSELSVILAQLPKAVEDSDPTVTATLWRRWQQGLSVRFTLPTELPPLRMLLVLDNLAGHKTPDFVLWFVANGIMPLYTPLAGSWLNMAESIQRILVRRALAGQSPESPERIIQDRRGGSLEPGTDAVCVGRQAGNPAHPLPSTPLFPGRLRRLHPSSHHASSF